MRTALLTPLAILCLTATAAAQTVEGNAALQVGLHNHDGLTAGATLQSGKTGEHRFGLRFGAGLTRERFIGGYVAQDATMLEIAPRAFWSLIQRDGTRFGLLTEVGARAILAGQQTPAGDDRSIAVTTRFAPTFTQRLLPNLEAIFALHINTDLAIDPAIELDTNAFLTEVGLRYRITPQWALTAAGTIGGAFGYGGDGTKAQHSATLGAEYAIDTDATVEEEAREPGAVGAFLDTGWRGYAIGGHLSHGPEVRAGVALWEGALKVGVAFISRPGPFNPQEFDLRLPDGETYKGQSTIPLRSDGATFGLMLAPTLPVTDWLSVELPVTVGQAGYGFYFQEEDRDTPDGRRVSEWENELQDGRDASFALGIDAGVRLKFKVPGAPWIQPMIGAHYLIAPGYDAFMSQNYDGFSLATGVQLALF